MGDGFEIGGSGLDFVGVAVTSSLGHGESTAGCELVERGVGTVLRHINPFGLADGEKIVFDADNVNGLHWSGRAGAGRRGAREIKFVDEQRDQGDDEEAENVADAAHDGSGMRRFELALAAPVPPNALLGGQARIACLCDGGGKDVEATGIDGLALFFAEAAIERTGFAAGELRDAANAERMKRVDRGRADGDQVAQFARGKR